MDDRSTHGPGNTAGARKKLGRWVLRKLLGGRVTIPPPAGTFSERDLLAGLQHYNEASERYFAEYPDRGFLLAKPFGVSAEFGRYLFNLGVLVHWGRISPGDEVLDFGAGSCWLSHFLNRYGCPTVSIDVSPSALEIGRELFERDGDTRWELDPRFESFDGHTLPLPDASCDRIVVHDAFHHIPNQREILCEFERVLRPGGLVAMVEPGRIHSTTADSRREMNTTGVLENDIVVEDLAALAAACGFQRTTVVPLSLGGVAEVPAGEFAGFLKGEELSWYWPHQAHALLGNHFLLLYKGEFRPTSRRPEGLAAHLEWSASLPGVLRTTPGERLQLAVCATNAGPSWWLAGDRLGSVFVGAHLLDGERRVLDQDWARATPGREVGPGDRCEVRLAAKAPREPGRYTVEVDLVSEGVCWFAQQNSPTLEVGLEVAPDVTPGVS